MPSRHLESRPVVAARESYGAQSGGWCGTPATRQIDRHPLSTCSLASAARLRSCGMRPAGSRGPRVAARVAVRASSSEENAGETLDDLPPPIKLTADQARIAALAFEVLYEKDPVEDLEEMSRTRRSGLRLKLQQAIEGALAFRFVVCRVILSRRSSNRLLPSTLRAAANEVQAGATVECAVDEEVDGLEDAAMRAGMTQNAPSGFSRTPH